MKHDTAERILDLCSRARARGWKFVSFSRSVPGTRGCALSACANEIAGVSWIQAGHLLGLEVPDYYGYGFDDGINGRTHQGATRECDLGDQHGATREYDLGYQHGVLLGAGS